MEILEQKQLADWLLDKLSFHPDVVLAGGAPRDWSVDREAKDLDFFFGGVYKEQQEEIKQRIEQEIGYELSSITPEKYEDSPFVGYECEIEGQPVQFLLHTLDTNTTIDNFPMNSSRASYKGGEIKWGKNFFYFVNYGIIIEGSTLARWAPDPYFERVVDKFPECFFTSSVESALKHIGGNQSEAELMDEF